ncbi:hypothetical protein H5410_048631 [Solanum commersonii]|uniref:Uncharacterized protein n=1 Tax=Solanum commersonii TaxID=4109 RepID=A0A9J5XK73_SOLCO|nr:hypothetical protein H5410_048631 [Solanum commersonii]
MMIYYYVAPEKSLCDQCGFVVCCCLLLISKASPSLHTTALYSPMSASTSLSPLMTNAEAEPIFQTLPGPWEVERLFSIDPRLKEKHIKADIEVQETIESNRNRRMIKYYMPFGYTLKGTEDISPTIKMTSHR